MEKSILLIDDSKDHIGILDVLVASLKKNEQIDLISKYINPIDRTVWDDEGDPQLAIVIKKIVDDLLTIKPDLLIVDQYYSGVGFTGLDIIEELRKINKFKYCKIFLISGKREKIVRDVFENKKMSDKDKVEALSKIINFGITRFLDKSFQSEAIETLKRRQIHEIIPRKFMETENKDIIIPKLTRGNGKIRLGELALKIEENSLEGEQIFSEMIDLSVAFYSKVLND